MFQNQLLLGASVASAFDTGRIEQAAWFDGSADYQTITFGAGNSTRIGTISLNTQFCDFGTLVYLIDTGGGTNSRLAIRRATTNKIEVVVGATTVFVTTPVYRDVRYYNITLTWDTTQATAADRFTLLINGEEPTYDTDNRASISQNTDLEWGESGSTAYFCRINSGSSNFFNGYQAQFFYADGSEETTTESIASGDNGLIPAPLSDSTMVGKASAAGGNSFCLTSAIGDGTDASTNGNNWTPTSMSHAANGSSNTPSNVYPVFNILHEDASGTLSEGNLTVSGTVHQTCTLYAETGKYAWKVTDAGSGGDYGVEETDGTETTYTASANDVLEFELDADNGTLDVRVNGGSATSVATGLAGPYTALVKAPCTIDFEITSADSTYNRFNTANLPTPEYQGADYFQTLLFEGTGAEQSVTGAGGNLDFWWLKNRDDGTRDHVLSDKVRGITKALFSSGTFTEEDTGQDIKTVDADGITVGTNDRSNGSGDSMVAWGWKANGAGVSNSDGSRTVTVSAADAGHFSIVADTGTGSGSATLGHGLPGAPNLIISKGRTGTARSWRVGSDFIGTPWQSVMFLDATNTPASDDDYDNTAPTGTVFSVADRLNESADYIHYCYRSVPGVCKVGSYTGNGSTDGPYVHCGFKIRWIIGKRTNSTGSWWIYDTARSTFNPPGNEELGANLSAAEPALGGGGFADILSDGFKLRVTRADFNASGGNYGFIAMADIAGGGDLPPIPGR